MEPLHLAIALGPVAVYLILLGAIQLSGRPFLTTGTRDQLVLGLAVAGLFATGPCKLFMPEGAAAAFGPWVWLIMLSAYVVGLLLLALLLRPRLIIYNMTSDQLRPLLATVAVELDCQVRWAGDCLVLPQLGAQLHIEPSAGLRVAQLVAAGPRQAFSGWRQLEVALARGLRGMSCGRSPYGLTLLGLGLLMLAIISGLLLSSPEAVLRELNELLGV